MKIDRRALLGGLAAAVAMPPRLYAATITDATGRAVSTPDHVVRVYPAGPPAAVTLYTLAPDLMLGWIEPPGEKEREFLLPDIAARPQLPRIAGHGDTNLDGITSLKPDLILDIGTVNAAYSALAERIQRQTGIPYALLDGHLDRIGATYRTLGQLTRPRRGGGKTREHGGKHHRHHHEAQRRRCRPRSGRGSIMPATKRPADRPRRLDDQRADRVHRRAQCRRRSARRARHRDARSDTGDGIPKSSSPATGLRRERRRQSGLGRDRRGQGRRVHLAPKLPFGWVDYPPAVNRLIGLWWLAKIFYPRKIPRGHQDADAGFLHLVLSRHPDGGAGRARARGPRLSGQRPSRPTRDARRRAGGRPRPPHGRRRQGRHPASAARPCSSACWRGSTPQCRGRHSQRQRRSGPFRRRPASAVGRRQRT